MLKTLRTVVVGKSDGVATSFPVDGGVEGISGRVQEREAFKKLSICNVFFYIRCITIRIRVIEYSTKITQESRQKCELLLVCQFQATDETRFSVFKAGNFKCLSIVGFFENAPKEEA